MTLSRRKFMGTALTAGVSGFIVNGTPSAGATSVC